MFTANLAFNYFIMLKDILGMYGVHELSKKEQSTFFEGSKTVELWCCNPTYACCMPQPIPYGCASCGTPDYNGVYVYGTSNCPLPSGLALCI